MNYAECSLRIEECTEKSCKHIDESCAQWNSVQDLHSIFYPELAANKQLAAFNQATAICMTCPVAEECLEWAALSEDSWREGVFGGLRPSERRWIDPTARPAKPDVESALELLAKKKAQFEKRSKRRVTGQ
jgi:hypothetical protein